MTRKFRRIVFYLLTLAFIVFGTGTVLYAQGWRLDFTSFLFNKIGAIYVRSFPAEANIFLDGKPVKSSTGFFQAGTLINDLFPKKYKLSLTFPNFKDWERTITVKPSFVAEAKYAVLVPVKSTLVTAGPLKDFWLLGQEPLVQNATSGLSWQNDPIPGNQVIGWTDDFKSLLTFDNKQGIYYLNDLQDATSTNINTIIRKNGLKLPSKAGFFVDKFSSSQIIVQDPASIGILDLQKGTFATVGTSTTSTTISAPDASQFWMVWASYDKKKDVSTLMLYSKFLGTTRSAGTVPGLTAKLEWTANNLLGVRQANGEFYIYSLINDSTSHVASDVKDFKFTDDGSMVAALENRSMEVFSLNTSDYWRFNLPDTAGIKNITWYKDGEHIFVFYGDRTSFLDLGDTLLENFTTISSGQDEAYDPQNNQFYSEDGGRLLRFDFPS